MRVTIPAPIPETPDHYTIAAGEWEATEVVIKKLGRQRMDYPGYTLKRLNIGFEWINISAECFDAYVAEGKIIINKEGEMSNLPAVRQDQPVDVFAVMDRLDDEIIQAELENRMVSTWVYSFKGDNGQQQMGLSKKGVDEACTEMAKKGHLIEEEDISYSPCPIDKEYVLFKARVRRVLINGDGGRVPMEPVFGTKRQWIKDFRKNGPPADDKFWFEKGCAKALRNARSRLIPAEIQAAIIGKAKQTNKVREIEPQAPPPPTNPGEATKDEKGGLLTKATEKLGTKAKAMEFIKWAQGTEKYWTSKMVKDLISDFDAQSALYADSQR
jgi:hypothetical protein